MHIRISCRFVTQNFTHNKIIHLEMWTEFPLLSSVKYGFHCISFPTTHKHLIQFLGQFRIEYFQNCSKLYRKKIPLPVKIKYDFHCTDFYNTNFCSTGICEDFRYRISLISAKKYEMLLSIGLGTAVYIGCHKTDFQGTPPYSATFYKELLNRKL